MSLDKGVDNIEKSLASTLYKQLVASPVPYEKHYYENTVNDELRNFTSEVFLNLNVTSISLSTDKPQYSIDVKYNEEKDILNVYLKKSKKIYISPSTKKLISGTDFNLIVFGDNNGVYREYQGKLIPLSVKSFVRRINDFSNYGEKISDIIFAYFCNLNPFIKDVIKTINENDDFIIPVNFNELLLYHNKKEFFYKKYKIAKDIDVNYNKRDMQLCYLILKCWNKVLPEQQTRLLQVKKIPKHNDTKIMSWEYFVFEYIIGNLKDIDADMDDQYYIHDIVQDYIELCKQTKTKININYKTVSAVEKAHDELCLQRQVKGVHKLTIKKNTCFAKLRILLPDEFEWIKTKKRIIEETNMQHNCVWTYVDRINKDVCQIYSYVHGENRYTLEFRIMRGKYYLAQIRGKYNSSVPIKISQYIENILSKQ